MKRLLHLTGILCLATCCTALGASPFEIDLKELPAPRGEKPAEAFEIELGDLSPSRRDQARPQTPKPVNRAPAGAAGGTTPYTVRPGDHLFLILIRHFGLSNEAAERLIPEVMRQNGISDPHRLQTGQVLKIPLAPRSASSRSAPNLPSARPAAEARPAAPRPERPLPAAAPPGILQLTAAPPCTLAARLVDTLGLRTAPHPFVRSGETFTASHAGLTVVTACGLSGPERYTYERLLSPSGVQLLVFDSDEPLRRVIDKLANSLGLRFQTEEPAGAETGLSYQFEAIGPDRRTVRVRIEAPKP